MKAYNPECIRNIGIVGHGGNGKTTLTESMLFTAGVTDRMGRVEDGTTVSDYDPEETKRHISINASVDPYEWKNTKINIIDVPGYFDFVGEMPGALEAADGVVIVLSAVSGLDVGAEKAWNQCQKKKLPRMLLVNMMDRENANYFKTLDQLTDKYGTAIAPVMVPIMEGETFAGYANVITGKGYAFAGKEVKEREVPEDLADRMEELRETIVEAAAENDEELLEKFFGGETLTEEEIATGLRVGVASGSIVPVLCSAAVPGLGVPAVMDAIVNFMPSPASREPARGVNPKTGAEETRSADPNGPLAIRVWKTVTDPFVGKLSLLRVLSGTLKADSPLFNPTSEKPEKAGTIYVMRGKKQTPVDALEAGDIGAIAKLTATGTGDTLCDPAKPFKMEPIEFPEIAFTMAVKAKKAGEEDKVIAGLRRLEDEDPTFKVRKSVSTGDMMVSGQGELHLDVILKKLAAKFGVEAFLAEPKVPYRETIRKTVQAEGRHKKQTGGHGQFGHCWIRFEPILDGSADFEFVDQVVGGVVPKNFIPAVEKGLRECLGKGVLAGYPVVGIRCTLYDGSYHSVDSSEMAFKTAAHLAFKKGCSEANPVLLEPINRIEITVPDEYMGDVIGDMNKRRGRIMGMNPVEDGQQVVAEVPQAEIFKYATDLRSMTQSRGYFHTEFVRYEEVPGNIAQKVVEQAKVNLDEDE